VFVAVLVVVVFETVARVLFAAGSSHAAKNTDKDKMPIAIFFIQFLSKIILVFCDAPDSPIFSFRSCRRLMTDDFLPAKGTKERQNA
jgi:hypothetical protein